VPKAAHGKLKRRIKKTLERNFQRSKTLF